MKYDDNDRIRELYRRAEGPPLQRRPAPPMQPIPLWISIALIATVLTVLALALWIVSLLA